MNVDQPRVAILTDYLLHPTDSCLMLTSENFYLLELARFIQEELGWSVDVFQVSPIPERRFNGLNVKGIDAPPDSNWMYQTLNFSFFRAGLAYDLRIYHHWHLAFPQVCHRSIVISQGIFWDSPAGVINRQNSVGREEWEKRLLYAVAAPARFVAQDRNTVNVIKATWPGYEHRLLYLPPGVDLERYQPPASRPAAERVRVICPQDFGLEQGINEIISLAELLVEAAPEVDLHIVGRMREFQTAIMLAKRIRALENCRFYWVPTTHLAELYRTFDLALLPYRAGVGVSIHCLRAMACGLPIVAGLAGGLAEMSIDGWNGRLVPPGSARILLEAVVQLARDRDLRLRMGENARRLAEGYPLSAWKRRWKDLLERTMAAASPGIDAGALED